MTRAARTMLSAVLLAALMSPLAAPAAIAKEVKSNFGEMKRKCSPFDVVLGTLKDVLGSSSCSYFGVDQKSSADVSKTAAKVSKPSKGK